MQEGTRSHRSGITVAYAFGRKVLRPRVGGSANPMLPGSRDRCLSRGWSYVSHSGVLGGGEKPSLIAGAPPCEGESLVRCFFLFVRQIDHLLDVRTCQGDRIHPDELSSVKLHLQGSFRKGRPFLVLPRGGKREDVDTSTSRVRLFAANGCP